MRNLRNIGRSLLRFTDNNLPLTATAWDASSNSLICAFGPCESRAVIELKRLKEHTDTQDEKLKKIASWDAPCPLPSLSYDAILDLHYFSDSLTSCLILAGGDIIIVREEPLSGEDLIEIVGSVDAGISAAAWSPDEELLAIITQANTILYMTREFESVTSANFSPDDIKVSNHVSVGWGKAETQFKGKRAKALRDPTMPEHVDEGVLSPFDDRSVAISWRGDGAYVAVNTVESETRRIIRIYSREGLLDSVSEPVDGLESALSWRPSGNLLAGIQRLNDRIDVVFFERNGLRHGQFSLRLSSEELENMTTPLKLKWNNDSSVLAVCFPEKAQLWTMGNYHYYLKQEVEFPRSERGHTVINTWHPERPLRLALATSDSLQTLEYVFTTASGSTCSPNDFGLLSVIDGSSLKVTPLRVANIPPPMSLHQLYLKHNALDVAISNSSTRIAVLSETDISLYSVEISKKPIPDPVFVWRTTIPLGHCPRQIAFKGDAEILLLTSQWDKESSTLWKCGEEKVYCLGETTGFGSISNLFSSINREQVYLQTTSAFVVKVDTSVIVPDTTELRGKLVNKFPSTVSWVQVADYAEEAICFGLTTSGVLYANERVLIRNCTSFLVTHAHLIFTTTQHLLKFVHLTTVEELEIPLDEPEKDERCRTIERGARLVIGMPTAYSVVLQMPRGNLETIYPRALVLASIRRSIEMKDYKRAFLTCRSQRVDMNILHDHAPEQFMANVHLFVKQIKKVEHIDLFLSQLRDEDVSETMYKDTIRDKVPNAIAVPTNGANSEASLGKNFKVNRICDAFLKTLEVHKDYHLQNIITAHVCKTPPDLDAGLRVVGNLQEAKDAQAERAAEHICFLADVNQLYDSALGLYNLELALLIAQQSQKDPREYLPYLQSLQELPPLRLKFKVDDQLGRRTKALTHLHALEAFDELRGYVEKHSLYSDALEIFKYEPLQLNEIMKLYADYLSNHNQFKEAGIAYEYLSNHASASDAYRSANLWRESLSSAMLANLPAAELTSLASTLAEGLVETKDFFSAATIHLDYLSDIETAARVFCKGYFFSEAIRVVTLQSRPELIDDVVDPGLVEGSASMTELLADCKGQIQAQVPRLQELRVKKAEDPLAFFDGPDDPSIPDNISLAPTDHSTSAGTFMTRYTNRTGTINTTTTRKTSKNRRREERKRARGKKGSVYEEEYLVNSISRLIERVNSVNEEVQRLCEGLMRRGMRERAAAVQAVMREVVGLCEGCLGEVFLVEKGAEMEVKGEVEDGGERPVGADGVLWDSLEQSRKMKEAPVVKAFEGMRLL
ncbi:elongator complex protein 1 [Lepidopterella palustris CBS 459.81]|uniref:Elongator complex protein 1 n=1 Tax=Lepidopterella palustris CBS 459.81 TaxID=1314670 RepID=A0A8E2ED16_9PEZI|nr:elongator complex protein 1 [Lepidopterella palustris CBS 459.81]